MRRASLSADDLLIARLHAPPDLGEGVEALAYWRERRRRLSWYRVGARREAAQMIRRWEERVRGALLSQPGVPMNVRLAAGLLVAQVQLRRWSRRILIGVTAVISVTLMLGPLILAAILASRIF
jgi:hypothetical protein